MTEDAVLAAVFIPVLLPALSAGSSSPYLHQNCSCEASLGAKTTLEFVATLICCQCASSSSGQKQVSYDLG